MKSQEQRIQDAARVVATHDGYDMTRDGPADCHLEIARAVLEAADREPPSWPTDASYACLADDTSRENLRDAMVRDPIIQRAREARAAWSPGRESVEYFRALAALFNAVDEAGL